MLFIINKKDISFGHNQNRNLHTTAPIPRFNASPQSRCFLTSLHVQVFVQVSGPVHQHGVGALGAGRGPQVPMLRPGGPGGSLHRDQAQRQQRPGRPPGGQPPLPQGLGPRPGLFRKQSHLQTFKSSVQGLDE